MNKQHSNIAPAVKLAQQLYTERCTPQGPAWDQLQSYGPTQSVWIERAEALMSLPAIQE
jgi:hypothetical protein